jgi:hypothetical protein
LLLLEVSVLGGVLYQFQKRLVQSLQRCITIFARFSLELKESQICLPQELGYSIPNLHR